MVVCGGLTRRVTPRIFRRLLSTDHGGLSSSSAVSSLPSCVLGSGPGSHLDPTTQLHLLSVERHRELGPLYLEQFGPELSLLFVGEPELAAKILRSSGTYPKYVIPLSWQTYNRVSNRRRGLFFLNGETWWDWRKRMQPILLKAPTEPVSNHGSEQASQTTLSLMELWRNLPSPPGEEHWKTIPSFNKQLCKWSVDCNLAAMFGVEHQQLDFDASLLVDHVRVVMETSAQLQVLDSNLEAENETELWHIFYGASESMLQMLENFVLRNPGSSHQGLIGRLRHEGRFHLAEVARIVADLIVAAADTTSTTAQWVLHLLACNPDEQEKIFADLSNENSDSHSPRIRWCLKEAMRLYPVAPFLTRVLPDPVDLSGHLIPAGQTVLVSTYAMGRSADYYDRPDEFWPDRWERQHMKSVSWGIDDLPPSQCDKDLKELGKSRAFSSLPFGFGRRACIGRRLAEDQLTTLTENVILNFELKNLNKAAPLEMTMRMTGVPVDEVQIGIKKRK